MMVTAASRILSNGYGFGTNATRTLPLRSQRRTRRRLRWPHRGPRRSSELCGCHSRECLSPWRDNGRRSVAGNATREAGRGVEQHTAATRAGPQQRLVIRLEQFEVSRPRLDGLRRDSVAHPGQDPTQSSQVAATWARASRRTGRYTPSRCPNRFSDASPCMQTLPR